MQRKDAGASVGTPTGVEVDQADGWETLQEKLAVAVGLPAVADVWVKYPDGVIEGPLPDGRGSWRTLSEDGISVLVSPKVVSGIFGAAAPVARPARAAAAAAGGDLPGLEAPPLLEEEQNWKRIQALFLDKPCPVPRIMQQVTSIDARDPFSVPVPTPTVVFMRSHELYADADRVLQRQVRADL